MGYYNDRFTPARESRNPEHLNNLLKATARYCGRCSNCGTWETRWGEGDGLDWATWECVCGWFIVAPNSVRWM